MKKLSNRATKVEQSSTLLINDKVKQLNGKGYDVVGFGAGEPDFDTPQNIKQAAIDAINSGFTKYTANAGIIELREAICAKLKNDNDLDYHFSQIVVSNGAKHCLNNIFTVLLDYGDEVILPAPYWLSYYEMIRMAGGVPSVIYTKEDEGFKITKEQLESAVNERTKAIMINSPNNPTGVVYDKEDLQIIADFAVENDLYVISDEIYEKLIYDGKEHISIASLGQEIYDRTIVVNGFSKSYSMTGWRVGYTASSKRIAEIMTGIQSHGTSNINSMSQKAAVEALLGGQDAIKEMCKEFSRRRDYIYERVSNIKLVHAIKPMGAFYIFVNVSKLFGKTINGTEINDAVDFTQVLLDEAKVAVVPCNDFGFDTHIRLSFPTSIDRIKEGLDRFEKFVTDFYTD